MRFRPRIAFIIALSFAAAPFGASGQSQAGGEVIIESATPDRWVGRYSKRALPRYASVKAPRAYFRLGPGKEYAIEWELRRKHLPVRVIGEYGNWRRVELFNKERGWIHRALLSAARYALASEDWTPLYERPAAGAEHVVAAPKLAPMRLIGCSLDWCELSIGGYRGWSPKRRLWGVDPDDVFR